MIYFEDEMKPGMMHDHIEAYSVSFWHTFQDHYRKKTTITMYLEENDSWDDIESILSKRYERPDLISVKYQ